MTATTIVLPTISLAHASSPVPNTTWIPAGPAIDTEKANIFTTTDAELTALIAPGSGKPGSIDLTDEPLTPRFILCLQKGVGRPTGVDPTQFSVTSPVAERGYFELQFDL